MRACQQGSRDVTVRLLQHYVSMDDTAITNNIGSALAAPNGHAFTDHNTLPCFAGVFGRSGFAVAATEWRANLKTLVSARRVKMHSYSMNSALGAKPRVLANLATGWNNPLVTT